MYVLADRQTYTHIHKRKRCVSAVVGLSAFVCRIVCLWFICESVLYTNSRMLDMWLFIDNLFLYWCGTFLDSSWTAAVCCVHWWESCDAEVFPASQWNCNWFLWPTEVAVIWICKVLLWWSQWFQLFGPSCSGSVCISSFDYEDHGYQPADLVKVLVLT